MSVGNSACFSEGEALSGKVDPGFPQKTRQTKEAVTPSRLRTLVAKTPRPLRFLGVGGLGLATDIALYTVLAWQGMHPLLAGFLALAVATLLTWRLNRAFTFDRSGRHQGEEAMRYAAVTAVAQGTSYAVFAALVMTALAALPQAAIIAGAAAGALISYNGQRLFAFAPRPSPLPAARS
jgi:putative flippase GtrA